MERDREVRWFCSSFCFRYHNFHTSFIGLVLSVLLICRWKLVLMPLWHAAPQVQIYSIRYKNFLCVPWWQWFANVINWSFNKWMEMIFKSNTTRSMQSLSEPIWTNCWLRAPLEPVIWASPFLNAFFGSILWAKNMIQNELTEKYNSISNFRHFFRMEMARVRGYRFKIVISRIILMTFCC